MSIDLPLAERRSALEDFGQKAAIAGKLIVTPCTRDITQAARWLDDFDHDGRDGVVAKRLDGPYLSGERAMIKVKLRQPIVWSAAFATRAIAAKSGSLLLGLYNAQGQLDHVGFTSTIANDERPALTRKLRALRGPEGFTGRAPGGPSRWNTERPGEWEPLRPELVVEGGGRTGAGSMHDRSDHRAAPRSFRRCMRRGRVARPTRKLLQCQKRSCQLLSGRLPDLGLLGLRVLRLRRSVRPVPERATQMKKRGGRFIVRACQESTALTSEATEGAIV